MVVIVVSCSSLVSKDGINGTRATISRIGQALGCRRVCSLQHALLSRSPQRKHKDPLVFAPT